jgi:hypothetical protein
MTNLCSQAGQDVDGLGSQAITQDLAQHKGKKKAQDTVKIFLPIMQLLVETI